MLSQYPNPECLSDFDFPGRRISFPLFPAREDHQRTVARDSCTLPDVTWIR
jgi:hypothetical protein